MFILTAALILTKTGRDALFFQARGIYDLPKAYMGMALLAIPMALAMLKLMKRLGPRRWRVVAPAGMATLLVFYHRVAMPGGGLRMTLLFTLVGLGFGVVFSLYWLLAADLFEGAAAPELARAYSLVGAASIAGGFFGGLAARFLAPHLEPRTFILLGALAVAGSATVVAFAQLRFPLRPSTARSGKPAQPDSGLRVGRRYTLLLLVTGMAASLVGVLVEFQFYLAAATSSNDARQNAGLFATVHLVLNGAALAIQLYVTPRLQEKAGLHGSLLVLPAALLGGAAMLLASASVASRALLRVTEGGLRSSIHRVSWEQAYLPVSRAQRAAAKLLGDGAGRVAEGLAALVLFLWLHLVVAGRPLPEQKTAWVTYLLLGMSLLWLGLTQALGRKLAAMTAEGGLREAWRPEIPLPDS